MLSIGLFSYILFLPFLMPLFFLPSFATIYPLNFFLNCLDYCILPLAIQYGFDDKDLIEYDLKKYLIKKEHKGDKLIKDENEKKNIDENKKEKTNKEDNEKNEKEEMIDIKTDKVKEIQKIMELPYFFFENLLLYIGPIQLLIKSKELSKEIFDLFDELKNRKEKDWITYEIHEFKKEEMKMDKI